MCFISFNQHNITQGQYWPCFSCSEEVSTHLVRESIPDLQGLCVRGRERNEREEFSSGSVQRGKLWSPPWSAPCLCALCSFVSVVSEPEHCCNYQQSIELISTNSKWSCLSFSQEKRAQENNLHQCMQTKWQTEARRIQVFNFVQEIPLSHDHRTRKSIPCEQTEGENNAENGQERDGEHRTREHTEETAWKKTQNCPWAQRLAE